MPALDELLVRGGWFARRSPERTAAARALARMDCAAARDALEQGLRHRSEAVRAGFKAAWAARAYQTIISVAQKLPEDVLQEDLTILQYYDNASMRIES